jgi:hypothetical protein
MDPRLTQIAAQERARELRAGAERARAHHSRVWPDDGLPAAIEAPRRHNTLHPFAVLATLATER